MKKIKILNKSFSKPISCLTAYSPSIAKILDGKHPERVIEKAITRMVPKGPLGRKVLRKLHIYVGDTHPHEAQKPEIYDVAKLNEKNKR